MFFPDFWCILIVTFFFSLFSAALFFIFLKKQGLAQHSFVYYLKVSRPEGASAVIAF
jgi:hypothetical protein